VRQRPPVTRLFAGVERRCRATGGVYLTKSWAECGVAVPVPGRRERGIPMSALPPKADTQTSSHRPEASRLQACAELDSATELLDSHTTGLGRSSTCSPALQEKVLTALVTYGAPHGWQVFVDRRLRPKLTLSEAAELNEML
jgi:hypothetical protein